MRYSKRIYAIAVVAALTMTTTISIPKADAHHGWSEYNDKQTLNLTGKIRSVGYDSPHTIIELEASDKKVWRAVLGLHPLECSVVACQKVLSRLGELFD